MYTSCEKMTPHSYTSGEADEAGETCHCVGDCLRPTPAAPSLRSYLRSRVGECKVKERVESSNTPMRKRVPEVSWIVKELCLLSYPSSASSVFSRLFCRPFFSSPCFCSCLSRLFCLEVWDDPEAGPGAQEVCGGEPAGCGLGIEVLLALSTRSLSSN